MGCVNWVPPANRRVAARRTHPRIQSRRVSCEPYAASLKVTWPELYFPSIDRSSPIVATTPRSTGRRCAPAASDRSSPGATPNTAPVSAATAGSSSAPSPGSTSTGAYGSATNADIHEAFVSLAPAVFGPLVGLGASALSRYRFGHECRASLLEGLPFAGRAGPRRTRPSGSLRGHCYGLAQWDAVHYRSGAGETTGSGESSPARSANRSSRARRSLADGRPRDRHGARA